MTAASGSHGTGDGHGRVPLDHLLRDRGADHHAPALERRRRGAVHERRQRALHVQRAAAVQAPVAQLAGRIGRPRAGVADADRVHVRVEQHARPGPGIERAGDVAERVHRDGVAEPLELRADERRDRALLARRARRPHEFQGKRFQWVTSGRHEGAHNACPRHPAGTAMRVREPEHIYRRRRLTALGGLLVLVVIAGVLIGSGDDDDAAGAHGGARRPPSRRAERAAGRRAQRASRAPGGRVLRRAAEPRAGRARDRQAGHRGAPARAPGEALRHRRAPGAAGARAARRDRERRRRQRRHVPDAAGGRGDPPLPARRPPREGAAAARHPARPCRTSSPRRRGSSSG